MLQKGASCGVLRIVGIFALLRVWKGIMPWVNLSAVIGAYTSAGLSADLSAVPPFFGTSGRSLALPLFSTLPISAAPD